MQRKQQERVRDVPHKKMSVTTDQFNPELDGQGRILSPVKKKHMPKSAMGESSLAIALRQAMMPAAVPAEILKEEHGVIGRSGSAIANVVTSVENIEIDWKKTIP